MSLFTAQVNMVVICIWICNWLKFGRVRQMKRPLLMNFQTIQSIYLNISCTRPFATEDSEKYRAEVWTFVAWLVELKTNRRAWPAFTHTQRHRKTMIFARLRHFWRPNFVTQRFATFRNVSQEEQWKVMSLHMSTSEHDVWKTVGRREDEWAREAGNDLAICWPFVFVQSSSSWSCLFVFNWSHLASKQLSCD